jgi:hypothetical protein
MNHTFTTFPVQAAYAALTSTPLYLEPLIKQQRL